MKQECIWYCCCPIKYFTEDGKLDKKWSEEYCHSEWEKCIRFQKEKNGIYHPDNMLPNGEIDENLS